MPVNKKILTSDFIEFETVGSVEQQNLFVVLQKHLLGLPCFFIIRRSVLRRKSWGGPGFTSFLVPPEGANPQKNGGPLYEK